MKLATSESQSVQIEAIAALANLAVNGTWSIHGFHLADCISRAVQTTTRPKSRRWAV